MMKKIPNPTGLPAGSSARFRHDGWTDGRQSKFLIQLADTGNVAEACRRVGLTTTSAYRLRQRNAAFSRAWDTALEGATRELEAAAFERAIHGVPRPVVRGDTVVTEYRVYSDALTMMLLRARLPGKYGWQVQRGSDGRFEPIESEAELKDQISRRLRAFAEEEARQCGKDHDHDGGSGI